MGAFARALLQCNSVSLKCENSSFGLVVQNYCFALVKAVGLLIL
uniref:Uncharacterized protein n=1 Tax=Nymphaea colorata TaxID=210225 RepID=A0A5K0WFP5_9MAGN